MIPLWLVALFTTSFAIGTDDMVIAGILPAIAGDFGTTEAVAGQLVTAFSLTYALGAPLMALATARFDRRRVLIGAHAIFVAANVIAFVAPTYEALLVLRVVAAVAAATITPIAYGLVTDLAPPERRGRYLGTITSGLTVSLIVGVPVGTWIGGAVGWRETFLVVAGLGFVALLGIARAVPASRGRPVVSLRDRLRPLRDRRIALTVLGVVISGAGGMMSYVYLAPLSSTLADAGPSQLALLIATFGVFGVAGTALGGAGADRFESRRIITLTFGGTTVAAALLLASTMLTPVPIVVLAAMIAVYGLLVWSVNPPVQMRLLAVAGDGADQVLALNMSSLYAGFTLAGAVGGLALSWAGATGLLVAAVALLGTGTVILVASFREERTPCKLVS
ncbi:MAG: MFS transporter [Actinomycetia bacterium]|nr:MFS transporter [Actinomycetes bacterium]